MILNIEHIMNQPYQKTYYETDTDSTLYSRGSIIDCFSFWAWERLWRDTLQCRNRYIAYRYCVYTIVAIGKASVEGSNPDC